MEFHGDEKQAICPDPFNDQEGENRRMNHISQDSTVKWPSEVPKDNSAQEGHVAKTDHIEDLGLKQQSPVSSTLLESSHRRRISKVSRHLKRYWICYFLGAVLFLAILLPIFFLVIFPALAQLLVNKADLPIYTASLMLPTLDTLDVSLVASINVPKPFSVDLKPVNLSLFRRETKPFTPYVTVRLPQYHLKGNSTIAIRSQTVEIINETEFKSFLRDAVYGETFTLSARGSTTANLGKLKAKVTLDKDVKLKGLDKLRGFSVVGAQAVLPPVNGNNLKGILFIPNHSIVEFQLGNVTLNLKIGNLLVGQGTIQDVTLIPGNNTVPFTGKLDLKVVLRNFQQIVVAEADALIRGNLAVSASGNTTIYDGKHIVYYEEVLRGLSLSTEIPVIQLLTGTLGGLLNNTAGGLGSLTQLLGSIP